MKSLRDLVLTLLTALLTLFRRDPARKPRPVHGPAHPVRYVPEATKTTEAPTPSVHERWSLLRGARPRRAELPPHLAAILAAAPAVEPEFERRPRARIHLLKPFQRITSSVRIYAPRPPAPDIRKPGFRAAAALERITRAMDPITRWLARASPARRVRAATA